MNAADTTPAALPERVHDDAWQRPYRIERTLEDEVQYLRGVGPGGADSLARLGVYTVWDLIRWIPRDYQDRRSVTPIRDVRPGEPVTVEGRIVDVESEVVGQRRLNLVRVVVRDGTASIFLVFFQRPYLAAAFRGLMADGAMVVCHGKAKPSPRSDTMTLESPEWEETEADAGGLGSRRLVPIYGLTEGLTQRRLRRAIHGALVSHADLIEDFLPESLREKLRVAPLSKAFRQIHFPADEPGRNQALRTLVLNEFLPFQCHLLRRRLASSDDDRAPSIPCSNGFSKRLRALLPHEPTAGQWRAIEEIAADLAKKRPMNRLLQGDVGSGKTTVAAAAMALCAQAGCQSAFMAPTEILARQHFATLSAILEAAGVTAELAVGSLPASEKTRVRDAALTGRAQALVGTHALQVEGFEFANLGLAVIDEQHRFGVQQRRALRSKGSSPHLLSMSATPIPRTLALSVYGDVDLSELRELPPGREPVKTYWKSRDRAASVYNGVRTLLQEGKQAFVVCPAVSPSGKLDVQAATELAERLSRRDLAGFRIGLVHGRLPTDERESAMAAFQRGDLDALVATTVIEVGVDVPNACVMVVEDADRFGLTQLHQLRGRVGRGGRKSFCVLLADPRTPEAEERLRLMTTVSDGFRLAEEDLRLRGPGEVLGIRQSGLPEFRFGNLKEHASLMQEARRAAEELMTSDPDLTSPELRPLAAKSLAWDTGFHSLGGD